MRNKTTTTLSKEDQTINQLLAISDANVASPVIKIALDRLREEEAKKQVEDTIKNLKTIQNELDCEVNALRLVRAAEAKQRKYVLGLEAAKQKFLQDGDFKSYTDISRALYNTRHGIS